jgi:hypothetical protein
MFHCPFRNERAMLILRGVPFFCPSGVTSHMPETRTLFADNSKTDYSSALAIDWPGARVASPEKYCRIPAVSVTSVCDPVPQNIASSEKSSTMLSGSEFVKEARK